MIRFEIPVPERELYPLRPLAGTPMLRLMPEMGA